MIKRILCMSAIGSLFFLSGMVHAESVVPFKENENVEITISKDNYNRIFVENDKILKLRFPEGYLQSQNDEDGSVYVDALDDRPFTLFITTKKGRHLSASVKLADTLGKTIKLKPKRRVAFNSVRHRANTKAQSLPILKLIKAVSAEKQMKGYTALKEKQRDVNLGRHVKSHLIYSLSNKKEVAQKFAVTNTGWKPVRFDRKWFKNKETLGLMVNRDVIYPGKTLVVSRVQEVQHG